MSKNSHTSNGALEDHGTLADSELDAVSGGTYEPAAVEVGDVKFTIGSSNYRATSKLTVKRGGESIWVQTVRGLTVAARALSQCGRTCDWMVRAV
jgi:hypothetical protein